MKKGDLSLNYVVIAAIALVVLIVIILFFTGGLQSLFQQQKEAVSGATDQQKEIWRSQCKLFCSLGQKENFEKKIFKQGDSQLTCANLDVTCGACGGAPNSASKDQRLCSQRIEAHCTEGCTWTAWS
ncbi:MAG: hypothetical protein Q8O03_06085 [Nanoarchaeota archaeon]|nr:hypothetical protein [Nanoarchaeota archaeon]